MRLDNYGVGPFDAFEPFEPEGQEPPPDWRAPVPAALPAVAPAVVEELPSPLLTDMARHPPVLALPPAPAPELRRLPRFDEGRAPVRREPQRRFPADDADDGGWPRRPAPAPPAPVPARDERPALDTPAAAEAPVAAGVPEPVSTAVPDAPATTPPPAAAPAPALPASTPPTLPDTTAASVPLPLGPVVNPAWLHQRETALQALRTDFEASRNAARNAPPADVAIAQAGWAPAQMGGEGEPVNGAVWVPDAAAAAAAASTPWSWRDREGISTPVATGQWLAFDDAAYEQAYRGRLDAQAQDGSSNALNTLARLYGEPAQGLLAHHPELWTLATQDHDLNAGPPPRPGVAMGDAPSLGQLDLYLADPFLTRLRTQLGGTPAAAASPLAQQQQALYGAARYAELTQLSQAMAAVRQQHAAAMQAARNGGGTGWVDVPMQLGTDPETGWPTGIYATVGDGEIQRDATGAPVLATQRVFDEALFTNAWLAEGERAGSLAQQAFAQFYGHAHGQIVQSTDGGSDSGGSPTWVSQASLDNPHAGLLPEGVWDGDLITLDLNRPPQLNNDAAVGFDPQLGWVTARENLYEHRDWFERAMPVVLVAFTAWATAGATAGWGAVGSAAATGAAASVASGIVNGNLSFKGVLVGALSGAVTAGLTGPLTGALKDSLGAAAGIAARMTVQGGIQALLGGRFKDGAIAGFASGLADLASVNIGEHIEKAAAAGTMSASEALAARAFNTVLSSAIRAAGSPGDPAQAFASAWLDGLMRDNLPPVPQPAPAPAPAPAPVTEVETFPVPAPGPVDVTPLPPAQSDLSLITPRAGESDSQFTVRVMREIYGQDVDLNPAGDHDKYQVYRDENGQLVISDGTGLNPPVDPKVTAAFEALLARRMQQLNAVAAVQRSQAFSDWAAANNRPVDVPPDPGVWNQRIPLVADVRDFLLAQIDHAVANTSGSGQVALEGLRIAVEALAPETYGDAALNELGAGVIKAGLPLAGVLKAAAAESRLGREVGELLQAASHEGGDVAGHLLGNAAEAEAREAGRVVVREVPGRKGDWNAALSGELQANATYVLSNGHTYSTDALGRVMKAEGVLNPATVDRNAYQQLLAGRAGGDGYDGGHLIGTLIGGAGEKINLVAQLSSVNRGEYRVMEKSWADAIQAGKEVRVEVSPVYSGSGQVPSELIAKWWIDGVEAIKRFPNAKG